MSVHACCAKHFNEEFVFFWVGCVDGDYHVVTNIIETTLHLHVGVRGGVVEERVAVWHVGSKCQDTVYGLAAEDLRHVWSSIRIGGSSGLYWLRYHNLHFFTRYWQNVELDVYSVHLLVVDEYIFISADEEELSVSHSSI